MAWQLDWVKLIKKVKLQVLSSQSNEVRTQPAPQSHGICRAEVPLPPAPGSLRTPARALEEHTVPGGPWALRTDGSGELGTV